MWLMQARTFIIKRDHHKFRVDLCSSVWMLRLPNMEGAPSDEDVCDYR